MNDKKQNKLDIITRKCVCPRCHGKVIMNAEKVSCITCESEYPFVLNDVPNFIISGKLSKKIEEIKNGNLFTSQKHGPFSTKIFKYSEASDQRTLKNILDHLINPRQLNKKIILDMGCGSGATTGMLTQKNEVWGVDILSNMLIIARENGLNCVMSSVDSLPFKDNSFDLVLCLGVTPYYEDPEDIIVEMFRVSKKGSNFIITSTANSLLMHFVILIKKAIGLPIQISHLYSVKEIENLIKKHGGKILESCMGYENNICQINNSSILLRYKLFSYFSAVLAKTPE